MILVSTESTLSSSPTHAEARAFIAANEENPLIPTTPEGIQQRGGGLPLEDDHALPVTCGFISISPSRLVTTRFVNLEDCRVPRSARGSLSGSSHV